MILFIREIKCDYNRDTLKRDVEDNSKRDIPKYF